MSDLLREALIGADPLDPRWTWLGGAAERLREHAPADEDTGAMYECADVLDVLHVAIRDALAIEPVYEYRAAREGMTGMARPSLDDAMRSLIYCVSPRGWIERRVNPAPGPWERVDA